MSAAAGAKAYKTLFGASPADKQAFAQAGLGAGLARQTFARPATPYIGVFGDSRVFDTHVTNVSQPGVAPPANDVPTAYDRKLASGMACYIEALTGGRVELPRRLNFGVSGQTTPQMVLRSKADMAAIKARGGSAVIILASTNDPGGSISNAQTNANLAQMVQDAVDADLIVIIVAEYPRGDSANNVGIALLNASLRQHMQTAAFIKTLANGRNIFAVDPWPALGAVTQAGSAAGWLKDGLSRDGLHLNASGNQIVAEPITAIIMQLWPPRSILPVNAADVYNADDTPLGVKTLNPMMFGTGGSKTAGVTGDLADGWSMGVTLPSGLAVACAKLTDADGLPIQQFTVTGTPSAGSTYNLLQRDTNVGTQGVAIGSDLTSVMHMEIEGGATGLYACQSMVIGGAMTVSAMASDANFSASRMPAKLFSGPVVTPNLIVPSGATSVRTCLQLYCNGSAVNAVIRVKRYGLVPTDRLAVAA